MHLGEIMITTRIVWEENMPSETVFATLSDLQKEKGYGPPTTKSAIEGTTDTLFVRTFSDLESAQEWVNIATQLGAKSAEIVPE
jgi:hypothetical protein